ncbi:MAG TPA: LEA type 2 family protein [Bacteroidales bacterium]|nr:LEA type 2 family protein [Bacteroidales bacterium]
MNRSIFVLLFPVVVLLAGCSVIDQINKTQALQQCNFEVKGVDRINLAGVELRQGMKRSDLNIAQVMQLSSAIFSNELPITFNVLLDIENPNDKQAMMSRMDYHVLLDGREMVQGRFNEAVTIPAVGKTIIPVTVQADLVKLFSGQQADALANLAFRLAGNTGAQPVELQVKVKPYIEVGIRQVAYPGFLTLKKAF